MKSRRKLKHVLVENPHAHSSTHGSAQPYLPQENMARRRAKCKLAANRRRITSNKGPSPLKLDPTRTATIRRALLTEVRKRFALLRGRIIKLVRDDDAFGLITNTFCPTGKGGGVDPSCSPSFPDSITKGGEKYTSTGRTGKSLKTGEHTEEYESQDGDTTWVAVSDLERYTSKPAASKSTSKTSDIESQIPSKELAALVAYQTRAANEVRSNLGKPPLKFTLKMMSMKDVVPSQHGEDYINDSSKYLSERIKRFGSSGRKEDYAPIAVDENNRIIDGNHRHAARKLAGVDKIPVLVPVRNVFNDYNPNQPRTSDGRFGSTEGVHIVKASELLHTPLRHTIGAAIRGIKSKVGEKITEYVDRAPGGRFLREKLGALNEGLKARYGEKTMGRIVAAANIVSWGASIGGIALTGVPIIIPSSALILTGAVLAEAHLQGRRALKAAGVVNAEQLRDELGRFSSKWHLTDDHKQWLASGEVELVSVPSGSVRFRTTEPRESANESKIASISKAWTGGVTSPVVEGLRKKDGTFQIMDGRHRAAAHLADSSDDMPMIVPTPSFGRKNRSDNAKVDIRAEAEHLVRQLLLAGQREDGAHLMDIKDIRGHDEGAISLGPIFSSGEHLPALGVGHDGYLTDGHHRLSGLKLGGQAQAWVKIAHLPTGNSNPDGCNQYKPCVLGQVPTPFNLVTGAEADDLERHVRELRKAKRAEKHIEETVETLTHNDIRKLSTPQEEVTESKVRGMVDSGHVVSSGPEKYLEAKRILHAHTGSDEEKRTLQDDVDKYQDESIRIHRYKGKDYINEGHHRLAAALALKQSVNVVIIHGVSHTSNVSHIAANDTRQFAAATDPEAVRRFKEWLRTQFNTAGLTDKQLWEKYAQLGYRKGAGRAFDDVRAANRSTISSQQQLDFYAGTRDEFLRSSFGSPIAIERLESLAERSFTDLENVTDDMTARMGRTLMDGLARGDNPRDLASDLMDDLDVSRGRAETIARTEIIRAHSEGQLDSLKALGVEEVGVQVEWMATADDRTCPQCADMEGAIYEIDEARGLIPAHPNCRCCFLPAPPSELSENRRQQVRNANPNHDELGRFASGLSVSYPNAKTSLALTDELRKQRGANFTHKGVSEIDAALFSRGTKKVVLRGEGGKIHGAVSIHTKTAGYVAIDHMGSTGEIKGTGRELIKHVVAEAVKQGAGIKLSSSDDAHGFYTKMGFKRTDYNNYEMSADDAKTIHRDTSTEKVTQVLSDDARSFKLPDGAKWIRGSVGRAYYHGGKFYRVKQHARLTAHAQNNYDPDQPRGSDGKWSGGASVLHTSLDAAHHLSDEHRGKARAALDYVLAKLPAEAHARLTAHVDKVEFHATPAELTQSLAAVSDRVKDMADKGATVNGCYRSQLKTLVLNGDVPRRGVNDIWKKDRVNAHETYAHEIAHAVDGPGFTLSSSKEWVDAWQREIGYTKPEPGKAKLSVYATSAPHEGWAEFGRLVYGTNTQREAIEKKFPSCTAMWKRLGLFQ